MTTGLPGSGKGTFAEVARKKGIPVLVMGDIVREEAKKRKIEPNASNLKKLARELREKYGDDVIAKRIIEKIEHEYPDACVVLVDGCRSLKEVEVFQKYAKVIIISIEAPFELRAQRIAKRGRSDDKGDVREILKQRDEAELRLGVGDVMRIADIRLPNIGSLEEFLKEAEALLDKLLEEAGCG